MKYYLISYGYQYYGNSSSASHRTVVTRQTPVEFIQDRIEMGRRCQTDENQVHITFAMEITEAEYDEFNKRV